MALSYAYQGDGGAFVAVCLSSDSKPTGMAGAICIESDTGKVYGWSGGQWVQPSLPATLTSATAALAADVAIGTANTWVNGPSITLDAGTWLVTAHATVLRNTTTAMWSYARITNNAATTHYASGEVSTASVANQAGTIPLTALIVLAAQTTIKVQATASQTATLKAATHANSSGNTATQLSAVKVA